MAVERFYIIKDGKKDGPFDETYVRFLLENDEVGFDDLCESEDGKRVRLGEMYEPLETETEDDGEELGDDREEEDEDVEPRRRKKRPRPGRVIYVGHPSFLKYTFPWMLMIAGLVGGCLIGPHSLWGMLAGFGLASMMIFYIVLERSAHVYMITARRIEAIHGLVAKDSTEVRVDDIRTINVRRSGIPGLMGVGTVDFSSTGDAIDVSFVEVWGARRIKKLVRRLQDELDG